MELPLVIEPLPDGKGFTASLTSPFQLSAAAATREEARQHLAVLLQSRIQEGMELGTLTVPSAAAGWLPDDELTRDWLHHIEKYRAECDAVDQARFGGNDMEMDKQ
jgi:predicted RNase H-like HicB family nuclease